MTPPPRDPRDHRDFNPNQLAASAGWAWIVFGWRLYRKGPLTWLLMLAMMTFSLTLIAAFPVIGGLLALAFVPGLGAGFMVVASLIERGLPALPVALIAPFRANPRAQLTLGVAYVVLLVLSLAVSSLADGGDFFRMLLFGKGPPVVPSESFSMAALLWCVAYLPVMAALWFAPALVHDAHMPPMKALFYSVFATARNWRAFLVYGMAWFLILFLIGSGLLFIASLFSASPQLLARGAMLPVVFMLMAVLYATFYVSYVTVFGKPPSDAPAPPPPPPSPSPDTPT